MSDLVYCVCKEGGGGGVVGYPIANVLWKLWANVSIDFLCWVISSTSHRCISYNSHFLISIDWICSYIYECAQFSSGIYTWSSPVWCCSWKCIYTDLPIDPYFICMAWGLTKDHVEGMHGSCVRSNYHFCLYA